MEIPEEFKNCPHCEEELRHIPQVNQKTQKIDDVLICSQCDQAFVINNNELGVLPYDSKMNLIEVECVVCKKIENHRQKMVSIIDDIMVYHYHCKKCAVEKLIKEIPEQTIDGTIAEENIFDVAEWHSMIKQQEIMKDPEKMKKVMASEPYKKIGEIIDNGNEKAKTE